MNFVTKTICNIDPTGTTHPLAGNGAVKKVVLTAATTGQVVLDKIPCSGTNSLRGYVQCDQALTLHFYQSSVDGVWPLESLPAMTVNASVGLADGGAQRIDIDPVASQLRITVDNPGAATSNFRLYLAVAP